MRTDHEFYQMLDEHEGYGYATYQDEDGWWWEFLTPRESYEHDPAIAGMGPFPTRSKALDEAAKDFARFGGDDEAYMLTLLEHADYYRYEETEY